MVFDPHRYSGIVVLRLPPKFSLNELLELFQTLLEALKQGDPTGKLWIIQKGRLRIYEPD